MPRSSPVRGICVSRQNGAWQDGGAREKFATPTGRDAPTGAAAKRGFPAPSPTSVNRMIRRSEGSVNAGRSAAKNLPG
ncbi:unnamed protein product, partial [Iphiclides podalirius]